MEYYVKSVVPIIESNYDKFTPVEKQIANFFIHNQKKMDFSIKHISGLLFTSKADTGSFCSKNVGIMDIKNLFINMKKL